LNFEPKISQTVSSSTIRVNQIKKHIKSSKFGVHDLSRSRPMKKNELPRFNMPFELGLDIGCMEYGNKKLRNKKILILENEQYHYLKVISDISGQDIAHHENNPQIAVKKLRDWLSTNSKTVSSGSTEIWAAHNQFTEDLQSGIHSKFTKKEITDMQISNYIKFAKVWISNFKS
jgi:hypothetical protein